MRLKQLRIERNITQLRLAMDLNMSQNTISRYENGNREASILSCSVKGCKVHLSRKKKCCIIQQVNLSFLFQQHTNMHQNRQKKAIGINGIITCFL